MTEQEAITIIKCEKEHHSEYSVFGEALQMAIQALENEKQIPKKPTIKGTEFVRYTVCPNCETMIRTSYCPECGQAIDWSDYD